ncbi:helicase-related protein [Pseudovibrio ascidiaceicola]|uniref:helicase-related protein n=1 Tax=Pseudovibrio ascidiaceicola TaxID=285279 RepID=UPI003D367A92
MTSPDLSVIRAAGQLNWRTFSEARLSKGQTSPKAEDLADLHRRRRETQGQFFTPSWVARGIWVALTPIIEKAFGERESLRVLDNSVGSGRLLEGMPAGRFELFGADVDEECIEALSADAFEAELNHEFLTGSMADLKARGFDIAVINPAFSILLESPNLTAYDCCNFGRFGPHTRALSHEYALAQALDAATVVAAVLPKTMERECRESPRLAMISSLPKDTFAGEGADVETAVFIFGQRTNVDVIETRVKKGQPWPCLPVSAAPCLLEKRHVFTMEDVDYQTPEITLPVTGNKRVELHHNARKIVIRYACGLTQAKVANGLLRDAATVKQQNTRKRLPKEIKYQGDGQFLLDVLLVQDKPETQLDELAQRIEKLGGEPWISPTLRGYYRKLIARHQRAIVPMHRVVKTFGEAAIQLRARKRTLLEPGNYSSASIQKDQLLDARPDGGDYIVEFEGASARLRRDQLVKYYEIVGEEKSDKAGWKVLHEGLNVAFPELYRGYRAAAEKLAGSWLDPFQIESIVEGLISPYGYIGAWEQGSGKTRYALALALLQSGRSMIVVTSGLLNELLREIKNLNLDPSLWKVLKSGELPRHKINITTYETLRAGSRQLRKKTVRRADGDHEVEYTKVTGTNAKRWRKQISTLICDEGSLLANADTQQTSAIKELAARKLIILDGTPQSNYPRDLLPLSVNTAGNGRAHQPYGIAGKPFISPEMLKSANDSQRGEDRFFDAHVVTQWVTNEFKEDLRSGGKREVPKINNLSLFRDWLAPNIQRRLRDEPALVRFKKYPDPEYNSIPVAWDKDHLAHYLTVATEFAQWYRERQEDKGRKLNLVTLLARIAAVQNAANNPHVNAKCTMGTYAPETSKQRMALERIKYWVGQGRKTILYARSPKLLARLHEMVGACGIRSVLFTGDQTIAKRTRALDDEFRFGDAPVLLSSWVGQRGLNLEQASAVIFYERDWSASREDQAVFRTLRPSQTKQVFVEYLHLRGSIDEYQAQLVEWKRMAADAGLDYGEQVGEEEEFLHLDTLIKRFCEKVLSMSVEDAKLSLAA